jgi:hypothetical protein
MASNLKRAATSAITPSGKKIPKLTSLTTPLPVANLFGSGSASLGGVIPKENPVLWYVSTYLYLD